jgi:uncharacterized membrane protein
MEIVYDLLVILHFIGLASLLGGFLVQLRSTPRVVNPAMLHGALTQLVTGLALVGVGEAALDGEFNHVKIGIKLAILLVITVLVWVNRRKDAVSTGVWAAIGALTIVNTAIAVLV